MNDKNKKVVLFLEEGVNSRLKGINNMLSKVKVPDPNNEMDTPHGKLKDATVKHPVGSELGELQTYLEVYSSCTLKGCSLAEYLISLGYHR